MLLCRLLLSRFGRAVRLPEGEVAVPGRPRPEAPARPRQTEEAPPTLLGQQQQESGRRGEQQQHEHGCGNLLHHCASLDAFAWSVLAVLALELVKQVQWLSSLQPSGRYARLCQLESRLAVLPQHQNSVPPATTSAHFSGEEKPHFFLGADAEHAPENQSPSKTSWCEEHIESSETGDSLSSPSPEPASDLLHPQGSLEQRKSFHEAASQVQQAFQASISMAFNILGLEHMQKRQHATAFHFFKLAADQNYSKAQFNVGVCYEHGRGTEKDMAKAVLYYRRAAHQGHPMAQHRYAKWLLRSWPEVEEDGNVQEAMDLLGQAAAAGLTQAQVYLGVLCLKGLKTGRTTAPKHSHVAAKSQDSLSSSPLGLCKDKGFGPSNDQQATEKPHQQAAVAASKPAQERVTAVVQQQIADMQSQHLLTVAPRPFLSSPCLQSLSQPPVSHLGQPVLDLIHSWSTGNLRGVSCLPHPAFPDCFRLSLRPSPWSPGIAIG